MNMNQMNISKNKPKQLDIKSDKAHYLFGIINTAKPFYSCSDDDGVPEPPPEPPIPVRLQ